MLRISRKALKNIIFGIILTSLPSLATAATVFVYDDTTDWVSDGNSGGGSSAITGTEAKDGNGSLELYGDRTRFYGLGDPYAVSGGLAPLSLLASATFDWMIATDSTSALHEDYSPALRIHVRDGDTFYELIWEAAYNGLYGSVDEGVWYTSGADDNFWLWQVGLGDAGIYNRSISDWIDVLFTDDAMITSVSVGAGSSAGSGYHAFADNVTLAGVEGGSTTFNFEISEVPAPPALLLLGIGLIVLGLRRKSQN
ncbi:PEP-CTERM sorting domain-containing protein [Emcibacter sp.]|uniref:PEP-CTERM sorting domain-containing protein n=1 Tax=Emcibacter sp. TaxID=1979954 RepID=UPI002AA83FCC|nr:PEP-CTERM sorting domain-containing protein [Emcibacter sp.]